jgi:heme-degrading monooxygenase HmoA
MIARLWRGVASTQANADAYQRHVTTSVFPSLAAIRGHRGAKVLRRDEAGRAEFLVMTLWDSMDAIREFAGDNPESAVVEPEARAVLSDYDHFVRHYEIALDTSNKAA